MTKIAIIYGLISGFILVINFVITVPAEGKINFDTAGVIGMTVMVVSMSLIFFAIRAYRKTNQTAVFSFSQGFKVGILTAIIMSFVYVAGWMVYYESAGNNFTEQYSTYCIEKINSSSEQPEAEKAILVEEFNNGIETYKNSIYHRIFYTFKEIFPMGFFVTIISALILKKKSATL
jgi:Protein of unknown function (DUF4199)